MEATRISTADEMEVFSLLLHWSCVKLSWSLYLFCDWTTRISTPDEEKFEIWTFYALLISVLIIWWKKKVPKVSCDGSHSCLDIACSLMIINVLMKKVSKVSCDGSHSYLDIACSLMIINVLMKKFQRFLVMEVTGRLLVDGDCIKRK